ncbi:MAG: hypothetical protein OEV42_10860 [Deltaproteobacteria bacterium]|nr:hypothetical protein [Deltaproteobacteria bacterium]
MKKYHKFKLGMLVGTLIVNLLLLKGSCLFAADQITFIFDYIEDSHEKVKNKGDHVYRDKAVRVDYKQVYGAAYFGNRQRGGEAGAYLKDKRNSLYGARVRIKENDESYQVYTDQVLSGGFVGKLVARYIHVSEPERADEKTNLTVYGIGFDRYYGDYNYFSAIYFNDPRESGRYSIVISNTLATEKHYLRVGAVPRSDWKTGYFTTVKYNHFFVSYSYLPNYDFSSYNRNSISLGYIMPFDL